MKEIANYIGDVYGRLTVVEYSHTKTYSTSNQKVRYWKCSCTCGAVVVISINSLRTGATKSCGCLRRETCLVSCSKIPRMNKGLVGTPEYNLWSGAKERAKKYSRDFDLEVSDIKIPELCPVFRIPLVCGIKKQTINSPTLDRLDNNKGYVKNNVWVISHKANSLKRGASVEELENLVFKIKEQLKGVT